MVLKIEQETDNVCCRIAQLRATPVRDARHAPFFFQLMREVLHHVADEETSLLPEVERLLNKERLGEFGSARLGDGVTRHGAGAATGRQADAQRSGNVDQPGVRSTLDTQPIYDPEASLSSARDADWPGSALFSTGHCLNQR